MSEQQLPWLFTMRNIVLKNSVSQFLTAIARRGSIAILLVIVARKGGVAFLGQYTLVFTLVYVFNQLAGFGTTQICIREVAKSRREAFDFVSAVLGARLLISVVAIVGVLLLGPLLTHDDQTRKAIWVFCLAVIPLNLVDFAQAVFSGYERMEYCAYLSLIQWGVAAAVSWVALIFGSGIVGLMGIQVVCFWAAAFLGLQWVRKSFIPLALSHNLGVWRLVLKQSWPLGLCTFFGILVSRMGTFQLASLKGEEAVGLFAPALHWGDAAQLIPYSLTWALLPVMSRKFSTGSPECEQVARYSHKCLFVAAGGLALATFVLAREATALVFGPKFALAAPVLQAATWALIPMFLNFNLQIYLVAANRQDIIMWNTATLTVLSCAVYFLLIRKFGPVGAGVAIGVCEMVLFCLNCWRGKKIIDLKGLIRATRAPALALSGALVSIYVFDRVAQFPMHRVLALLVYAFVLILSGALRWHELLAFGGHELAKNSVVVGIGASEEAPNGSI